MNEKTYEEVAKSLFLTFPLLKKHFRAHGHGKCDSKQKQYVVTPGQFISIMMLSDHGPMPISQLAKMINTTKPNMTMLVDRMESGGFVERRRKESDRRVVEIVLTEKARKGLEDHKQHIIKHYSKHLHKLEDQDVIRLGEIAEEMAEILSRAKK